MSEKMFLALSIATLSGVTPFITQAFSVTPYRPLTLNLGSPNEKPGGPSQTLPLTKSMSGASPQNTTRKKFSSSSPFSPLEGKPYYRDMLETTHRLAHQKKK